MTRNDLRNLFANPKGENVLLWILKEHHVFNANIEKDNELALRNWGMKFLSYLGPQNSKQSVTEFIKIAMKETK